jgi:hypothetical protein
LTPLGYFLTTDEIRQLSIDAKIVSCPANDTIYDRVTSYQPNDRSKVSAMYYFGFLCYGVAEGMSLIIYSI